MVQLTAVTAHADTVGTSERVSAVAQRVHEEREGWGCANAELVELTIKLPVLWLLASDCQPINARQAAAGAK